jgi:transposase
LTADNLPNPGKLPALKPKGRPGSPFFNLQRKCKHDLRKILDYILWLLRTGAQWRNIHPDWLPWQAVCFDQWKKVGLFEQLNAALNQIDRQQRGQVPLSSALCIDKQSVKLSPMICEHRGLDAHKRVSAGPPGGRKRTFVVDIQGRLCCRCIRG